MKRYLALLLLLALLFTGCSRSVQEPDESTPSTTQQPDAKPEEETDPTQPEKETDPTQPEKEPTAPPPAEPETITETEVDEDGTIFVWTRDADGKVLSRITYDPYSDSTYKWIFDYSENGFAMMEHIYYGNGNFVEEFAADNYENSMEYTESVPIDAYVDPDNAFSVTIEELAPLYRQAEEIWNKYGVVVLIADKLTEYRGDAELCLEYEWIKPNLDIIESCLALYPTDFFRYFDRTMCIQLAGSDGSSAGSYFPDERIDMVQIDAYNYQPGIEDDYDRYARSTLNHELCHAIDNQLHEWADKSELPLTEEQWNTLNPEGFTYAGYEAERQCEVYSYGDNYYYFISSYSCYSPDEDRATLFANAVAYPEDELTDQQKAKLQYFSDCIRAAFPSDDWDDVLPWEYPLTR